MNGTLVLNRTIGNLFFELECPIESLEERIRTWSNHVERFKLLRVHDQRTGEEPEEHAPVR